MLEKTVVLKAIGLLLDFLKRYVDKNWEKMEDARNFEKSEKLVSQAIRELLSPHPNIYLAREKIEQARETSPRASSSLYRAEEMLAAVTRPKRKVTARPTPRRKAVVGGRAKKKAVAKKRTAQKQTTTKKR